MTYLQFINDGLKPKFCVLFPQTYPTDPRVFSQLRIPVETGCLSSHTLFKNLIPENHLSFPTIQCTISHLIHIHVEDWKRNSKLTATFE